MQIKYVCTCVYPALRLLVRAHSAVNKVYDSSNVREVLSSRMTKITCTVKYSIFTYER